MLLTVDDIWYCKGADGRTLVISVCFNDTAATET